MMHSALVILLSGLVVSAHASTYDTALAVMQEVKAQNRYVYYAAKDFTPMVKGERGNCARFAATYADRMNKQGVETYVLSGHIVGVGPHAVAITTDGWMLDNLRSEPVRVESLGR